MPELSPTYFTIPPPAPPFLRSDTVRPDDEVPEGRLLWSIDACDNFFFGYTVHPMDTEGLVRPITLHPTRSDDVYDQAGFENAELCRHHLGAGMVAVPGGFVEAVFCHNPDNLSAGGHRTYVSHGRFAPAESEPYGLCEAGFICGISACPTPPWAEAVFHSYEVWCGGEQ